ncbi:DDE-type integrase/transposase/recombinase (plasmid) [Streptomyces sp. FXJ1.172]|uniref:DDE-type integrase/transposase/recombinase n=1 Tax=Streptomyces sp. FXJ1.172 TaxID=710705 RepID=UPI0023DD2E72|nr:DDE-type integrase/transposase/recombinase [Streptomyces sp. FXJ1.172]WEP01061.1 hypothetical protein A6P39_044355 [Streptomyces sp. FXJ1.172]
MADHHRAELPVAALRMAAGRGGLEQGCVMHTDRGSEYTSDEFRSEIRELRMRQSMGRVGSCYDNAAAESWFAILKAEIGTTMWETREAARADVFHYVEVEALSHIGCASPVVGPSAQVRAQLCVTGSKPRDLRRMASALTLGDQAEAWSVHSIESTGSPPGSYRPAGMGASCRSEALSGGFWCWYDGGWTWPGSLIRR